MKHTTIKYDPIFGAQMVQVETTENTIKIKHENSWKKQQQTVQSIHTAIVKKQHANKARNK